MAITYGKNSDTKSVTVPYPIEFTLESSGDGTGVATVILWTAVASVVTLRGGAKFYTTIAGNTGESATKTLAANTQTSCYIKCASGTSTMTFSTKQLTKIENWLSPTNSPYLGGDFSNITTLTIILMSGKCKWTASVSKLINLVKLYIGAGYNQGTISGNVGNLVALTELGVTTNESYPLAINNMYGDLSQCLLSGWLETSTSNPLGYTGDLTALALRVVSLNGVNSCSVTLDNITTLEYFKTTGVVVTCSSVILLTKLSYLEILSGTRDATFVNQILADFWANRDYPKTDNAVYRNIILNGPNIAAPTGQGLTDKSNLQAYRSPNNDGQYALWSVLTN